jgi:hypothetical protein
MFTFLGDELLFKVVDFVLLQYYGHYLVNDNIFTILVMESLSVRL